MACHFLQISWWHIRNWIMNASFSKGSLAQHATFTYAARFIFTAIAGPGQIERSAEFDPQPHNFNLAQSNQRGSDLDLTLARTGFYHCVERPIIFGTAIRIS